MGINLGDAILHLSADDSQMRKDLQGAAGQAQEAAQGINVGVMAAIAGVVAIGTMGAREIKAALAETISYATEIRRMSSITGEGAEATSRMIQVFGDFEIGGGQLTMMLRTMAKEGLTPNIETIAMLSDRYLDLAPGVERATFLQTNFGRSGADLALVMQQGGAALMARNAHVEAGLVLSQAEIDRAEELRQTQDDLSDAGLALTTTLALWLAPSVANLTEGLVRLITPAEEVQQAFQDINREALLGSRSNEEYRRMLRELAREQGIGVITAEQLADSHRMGSIGAGIARDAVVELTNAEIEEARAAAETARTGRDAAGGWDEGGRAVGRLGSAVNALPSEHEIDIAVRTQLDSVSQAILDRWGFGQFATFLQMGGQINVAGVMTGAAGVVGMSDEEIAAWTASQGGVGTATGPGSVAAAMAWRAQAGARYMSPAELEAAGYTTGQHGLGFDVEGPSGTDQVPVNLALTRGEHVDVTPAGEGGGKQVTIQIGPNYINNRDDLQALENDVMQIFRGV